MPCFTSTQPNLEQNGPIVEVTLYPSAAARNLMAAQGQTPTPVNAIALLDTGASHTCINPALVASLGLPPVGSVNISTPSTQTPVQCLQYQIAVIFQLNQVPIDNVLATCAPLGGQAIQMLIGRDVLKQGILIYTGYANQFTLSF